MEKRNYTHVQVLLPEIKAMLAEGKTQREVAEHYGFKNKQVVKKLLERERRKERKLAAAEKGSRCGVAPPQRPGISVHLASILQSDSSIRHYAFHVKERKPI